MEFLMPCNATRTLEKSATKALRVLLAAAILSPLAVLADNTHNHASFAGIYITRAPKMAPSMSVSLGEDGSATVTEDPGQGSMTLFGHWQDDGRQIKITFNAQEGEQAEAPMIFAADHNKLQPVSWNHDAWGSVKPPTMVKGSNARYLFWTATMR
jgi:hypothetical protein